jgi:hypothetical protein
VNGDDHSVWDGCSHDGLECDGSRLSRRLQWLSCGGLGAATRRRLDARAECLDEGRGLLLKRGEDWSELVGCLRGRLRGCLRGRLRAGRLRVRAFVNSYGRNTTCDRHLSWYSYRGGDCVGSTVDVQ